MGIYKYTQSRLQDFKDTITASTIYRGKRYWQHKDFPTKGKAEVEIARQKHSNKSCIFKKMVYPKTGRIVYRVFCRVDKGDVK